MNDEQVMPKWWKENFDLNKHRDEHGRIRHDPWQHAGWNYLPLEARFSFDNKRLATLWANTIACVADWILSVPSDDTWLPSVEFDLWVEAIETVWVRSESPIEFMLFCGFLIGGDLLPREHPRLRTRTPDEPDEEQPAFGASIELSWGINKSRILFLVQPSVTDFRADFAICETPKFGRAHWTLVVECDGHEYHERTKEQAARDRSRDRKIQELGASIHRFTGSEIYADPFRCGRELSEAMVKRFNKNAQAKKLLS